MATTAEPRIRSVKQPWLAALLSVLLPGLGHVYLARYRRAALWFAPVVIALIGAGFASRARTSVLIGAAVKPSVLWGLFGVNVVVAVWRIAAVADAYHVAGYREPSRKVPMVLTVVAWSVLSIVVFAPHVVAGRYALDALSLIRSVFVVEGAPPRAEPIIPIGTDADLVPDPVLHRYEVGAPHRQSYRNLIFREGIGDPEAVDIWDGAVAFQSSPGASAPFLPFNERVGAHRLTILLAGGDAGPGRGGLRTDTMIVATLDTVSGKAALFGFPRNLGQVPLPDEFEEGFVEMEQSLMPPPEVVEGAPVPVEGEEPPPFESCECFPDQLNALYPFTRKWTGTYPNEVDPGMAALRDTIANLMDLRIDYYVLVDMAAFVDLVDAIGGVDVYVQTPLEAEVSPPREGDSWAHVNVDVGWNHLNGSQALAYSRARKGSSDYVRMQRQRCMLRAVAAKANPLTLLRRFSAIVRAVEGSVVTDIPLSFAPDLITAMAELDFDDIETVGFVPPYWAPERDYGGRPIPDIELIREKVSRVIRGQSSSTQSGEDATECGA